MGSKMWAWISSFVPTAVSVTRNAAREATEGFHPLGLTQLKLHHQPVPLRGLLLGHILDVRPHLGSSDARLDQGCLRAGLAVALLL